MKFLALALLLIAGTAQARQYIQCAHYDTWDRAVINLNGDKSTLFMTSGVHNPDETRVLKKLYFVSNDGRFAAFETRQGEVKEVVYIPSSHIGIASQAFEVTMEMSSPSHKTSFEMGCFSAIYED